MEGLFDILFIIVTVIIFFISVFRKANKESDSSGNTSYAFGGIPEHHDIQKTEEANPAKENDSKKDAADNAKPLNLKENKTTGAEETEEILLEKKPIIRKKKIIKDFSPKKAILYSEIIHPKYF